MGKTKKNKSVREELERIYGKHCMIHQGIRNLRPPQPKNAKYKGKSIANQMTLHHLKPRRNGGATTLENGALVCRKCHDWLEQLPNLEREKVNNEIREYKANFKVNCATLVLKDKELHIEPLQKTEETIEIPPEIERGYIELEPMTAEEQAKYEEYKKQRVVKQYKKFGVIKKAHIDEEWQREIIQDNLDELRY